MKFKMKPIGSLRYFLLIILIFSALAVGAQQNYVISGAQELKITGTSTIHDWDMVATDGIKGTARMEMKNGKLEDIKSLKVEMPAKSLKSGKSSMDKNAYEALKANKFPNIIFEMTELIQINEERVKAKGKLTVADNSKIIPVEVEYRISGNQIHFSGSEQITFKDFGLEPPSAVLGTIKTGNELTLHIEINFASK